MNLLKEKIKNNKRVFFLGAGLIIIVCLIILVRNLFFREKMDANISAIYDINKLIPYESDGKYGYLNSSLKETIKPDYLSASDFYNNFAVVELEEKKYGIINESGKIIEEVSSLNGYKYIQEYGVWLIGNKIYNSKMEVVFEGNYNINYVDYGFFEYMNNDGASSGIVDYTGKIVFKWENDYIQAKISKNDYAKNGYYAFISNYEEDEKIISLKNGKEIFTLEDPKNTYIKEENDNIFRIIDRSDSYKTKTWLYIKDEKIAYKSNEAIYSMSLVKHDEDILEIDYGPTYKNNGLASQFVYYNVKTGKRLEAEPKRVDDALYDELYGYHLNIDGKKYGIKKNDRDIVAIEYDEIKFIDKLLYKYIKVLKREHLVLLKKEDKTILYNLRRKKEVKTFDSTSINFNSSSSFLTVTLFESDGFTKRGILVYNLITNKSLEFEEYDELKLGSNYVLRKNGDEAFYYNAYLEELKV